MQTTDKNVRRALPAAVGWTRAVPALRVLWVTTIAGCATHTKPHGGTPTPPQTSVDLRITPTSDPGPMPTLIHLDVYEVEAPAGDLSNNSRFWSMISSGALPPKAVSRLSENGLRCGLAKRDDWPRFRSLFDALPCRVRKLSVNGQDAPALPLDLGQKIDSEDLFFVDDSDRLEGRSFQACTNFVSLGFQPIDDHRAVRIALTPVVRSQRDRVTFSPLSHEYDSPFESTDHLFDVQLHADVPTWAFMVVGPAGGAMRPTSIGGAFFADRSGAELLEQVLVIIPTYLKVDGQKFTLLEMADRGDAVRSPRKSGG